MIGYFDVLFNLEIVRGKWKLTEKNYSIFIEHLNVQASVQK